MRKFLISALAVVAAAVVPRGAIAHCEIPCGIYDDAMRFKMIEEDIKTIEKSMKAIIELSAGKQKDYNQIVRWVENKDEHAGRIQRVVSQYFLTQRIKPVGEEDAAARASYLKKLALLHEMLVYAMKAKQGTDLANAATLRTLLYAFKAAYSGADASAQGKK